MNEQVKVNIKQRIVGAIVLVSLGIIIIPLLLNGGKDLKQDISNSNIPVLPAHLDKKIAPVADPKPRYKPKPVIVRPVDELTREPAETVKSKTKPVRSGKTEASQKVTGSEKKSSSPAVNYETVSKPKTTHIKTAYTIQVGSFGNKTNAFSLRDKLRKSKFRAYIESATISAGIRYRVRVGPFLKYDEVEKNRNKLLQRYKLKGTIIKYKT